MDEAPKKPPRRKPRKPTAQSLANAALYYLQRYASSAENLRRVLRRRVDRAARVHEIEPAESYAHIDALVQHYEAAGLLNDRAYAETRVNSLRARGGSARIIRLKLKQKGVVPEAIDQALADGTSEADELRAAIAYARRRRLGPYRTRGRDDSRDRDLANLARAGFSYDLSRRVVEASSPEALEDLLLEVAAER